MALPKYKTARQHAFASRELEGHRCCDRELPELWRSGPAAHGLPELR